jgi:hypothetical protein
MIIEKRGSLVMASIRGGAAKWYYEAKNSNLECEGAERGKKRLRIRNLLHDWKVDIVCLQETKLFSLSRRLVRSLWQCNYVDWVCLDSCGASGGILILWDKRVVEKIEDCLGVFLWQ